MTTDSSVVGFAPTVTIAPAPPITEQRKYQRMWERQEYRIVAPGENVAPVFLEQVKPKPGSTVIDFGTGTGRGALHLAFFGGLKVQMLDFAPNCLDDDIAECVKAQPQSLDFKVHDLTKPWQTPAQYGYCTDVMEHIPPEDVDIVLLNVLQAAEHVFFQISCVDDVCGKLIGHPLHLSVHPHDWWLKKLQALNCTVHWSQDGGDFALFYVTAWRQCSEFAEHGVLNVTDQQILDNVTANIAGDWLQVSPHPTNDLEAMILCGGPSLSAFEDEIKRLRAEGVKLITTNGTYNWAVERGLRPSAQIIVDARAHNARFVTPLVEGCKYLMASQVHPDVLANLPKDRTLLWHSGNDSLKELLNARYERWYWVPGGTTVTLRALPLMRMLGYKKFHLFGFDSCLDGDAHHAYAQAENDGQKVIPVTCGDRIFHCHPWMASQAAEFQQLVKALGDELELEVYGDGLIAHMLKTGAQVADESEFLI